MIFVLKNKGEKVASSYHYGFIVQGLLTRGHGDNKDDEENSDNGFPLPTKYMNMPPDWVFAEPEVATTKNP